MWTALRRLFWLALLGGGGYATWSWWQRSHEEVPAAPEWPPLDPDAGAGSNGSSPGATTADVTASDVAPSESSATIAEAVPTAEPPAGAAGTVSGFAELPADEPETDARWVGPVDGGCPAGYPIKANDKSGIYHLPGGRFYERTVPERCYARAEDAEADGYRAAKA